MFTKSANLFYRSAIVLWFRWPPSAVLNFSFFRTKSPINCLGTIITTHLQIWRFPAFTCKALNKRSKEFSVRRSRNKNKVAFFVTILWRHVAQVKLVSIEKLAEVWSFVIVCDVGVLCRRLATSFACDVMSVGDDVVVCGGGWSCALWVVVGPCL